MRRIRYRPTPREVKEKIHRFGGIGQRLEEKEAGVGVGRKATAQSSV